MHRWMGLWLMGVLNLGCNDKKCVPYLTPERTNKGSTQ